MARVAATQRGPVGETRRRLGGAAQRALGVGQEQAPGAIERGVVAQAREGVEQLLACGLRGAHVAAGDDAEAERLRLRHGAAGRRLERAVLRARDGEVRAAGAEDPERPIEPCRRVGPGVCLRSTFDDSARLTRGKASRGLAARFACGSVTSRRARHGDQRDEPRCVRFDFVPRDAGFAFRGVALRDGQQTGEVAVALAGFDQELERAARGVRELGAHERAQAALYRRAVEARDAVEAVAVREREGPVAQLGRALGQILGVAGPVQEREGAPRAELDVVAGHQRLDRRGVPDEPLGAPPSLHRAPAGRHPVSPTRKGRAREGHEGSSKKEPQRRAKKKRNQALCRDCARRYAPLAASSSASPTISSSTARPPSQKRGSVTSTPSFASSAAGASEPPARSSSR